MLALRLLLFFTCIGANASIFADNYIFSDTQSYHYESEKVGFYEDFNPFLYNPELKTESFPNDFTRLTPKVVYALRKAKRSMSSRKQLGGSFQYLKYIHTIDLKLANHSISYPFHSFP